MIEKLLKIASFVEQDKTQFLNDALEVLNGSGFEDDMLAEHREILDNAENMMPKLANDLNMSLIELDEFFDRELSAIEKNASAADAVKKSIPLLERTTLGGHAARGALGIGGAALTGISLSLLNDLYNKTKLSLTEKSNFENMLKHNPDLKEAPKEHVLSVFKTVHRLGGPDISGDPNIAGSMVRNNVILGDYGKGVDIRGFNDLINAKSNHTRGNQTIGNNAEFPGLDIYKAHMEGKKHNLMERKFDHDQDREGIEDSRYNDAQSLLKDRETREREKHELQLQNLRTGVTTGFGGGGSGHSSSDKKEKPRRQHRNRNSSYEE